MELKWGTAEPRVTRATPGTPTTEPLSAVQFRFSVPMDLASFSLVDDITNLTGEGVSVPPTGFKWLDSQTLEVTYEPQTVAGVYEATLGPDLVAEDGRPLKGAFTGKFVMGAAG